MTKLTQKHRSSRFESTHRYIGPCVATDRPSGSRPSSRQPSCHRQDVRVREYGPRRVSSSSSLRVRLAYTPLLSLLLLLIAHTRSRIRFFGDAHRSTLCSLSSSSREKREFKKQPVRGGTTSSALDSSLNSFESKHRLAPSKMSWITVPRRVTLISTCRSACSW